MDVLRGTIERVTYYNPENGYSVIKVEPEKRMPLYAARDGLVTVVGVMPELGVGENIEFTGEWITDPRYGPQMRVHGITTLLPTSIQGITRYLASGIVKGIGPRTAEKIVDHFGIQTLEILNREPQRIHEVPELKTSLAEELIKAWAENYEERQVMIFLQQYAISPRMARRIYGYYGASTISKVKENPYDLAEDVFGIGFKKADQIAQSMGIATDSPHRLRAGLSYTLNHMALDGHTYAPRDVLLDAARDLLDVEHVSNTQLAAILDGQVAARHLIEDKLLIDGQLIPAVYLPVYYLAEISLQSRLLSSLDAQSDMLEAAEEIEWDEFLKELSQFNSVNLTEQQQSAVKAAFMNPISVLTGGPGTGKTTTLQMVIYALEACEFSVALASPTGRAAKRLAEATGREAMTIHRMLGYSPNNGGFEYDEDNQLDVDMIIVDEASMIDLWLFRYLVEAKKDETHLMLVGDVDQLPSVGAGNVLKDLINSEIAHVTRLSTIFRQGEDSHIITNAHRINNGQPPFMDNRSKDFFFFNEEEPTNAADLVVDIVQNRIRSKFGFDPMNQVQVLAPMYRGPAGINLLNERLQAALNNDKRLAEKKIGERLFRVGDKVMQTRNNYDKEIFNGDIGRIRAIDFQEETIEIVYDNRGLIYDFTEAEDLIHAYAITIHRSQGSEYPVVVLPILTQQYMMLQRNLLYTAITRAKEMAILVGSRKAVFIAVNENKVSQRYSGLLYRLLPQP